MTAQSTFERTFPANSSSIRVARDFVASVFNDIERDRLQVICLLASELATDAIKHEGEQFDVIVNRFDDKAVIAATEESPLTGISSVPDSLGWKIVDELAKRSGIVRVDEDQEMVWAEVRM